MNTKDIYNFCIYNLPICKHFLHVLVYASVSKMTIYCGWCSTKMLVFFAKSIQNHKILLKKLAGVILLPYLCERIELCTRRQADLYQSKEPFGRYEKPKIVGE